jgi:multiple sugar transport system permease protein
MTRKLSLRNKILTYLILIALGTILAAPFMFIISIALASDETTTKAAFTFLPQEFHFENFTRIFGAKFNMGQFFVNSVILVTFSMAGQVFVSGLVAYGFARMRAPGKNILFLILLSTMMIPGEVTMIPQFVLFRSLGWFNTLLPLIVPNFFGGAYNIFLLRQFITRIPIELDEAAQIDGLGFMGIYTRIIMPLVRPALIAVAIFTFTWNWGSFMGPLIYINDIGKMPLALGVQILSATNNAGQMPAWNLVMVGALLLTLPMILVYFFGQRYIYELGLTSSGSAAIK